MAMVHAICHSDIAAAAAVNTAIFMLQGPNEIAMGCEGDPSSAFADVDTTFMRVAPFAPLGSAGFNYVVLPPSSDLWMIQDLKWTVSSSANVSLATMKGLVVGINNKTQNW
jgi:hypothetical protein